ncbi:MAG: GMC family oxidoreductase N-terminal domain-containing protein [Hyphomicrobium sp.]
MHRIARSLSYARSTYDVIVVGSGYGGGVAASRLSRAGKRVAVLERGREFQPGDFPQRFPDLKNELQVRGRRIRTGPDTALYDVRLGDDMHVLVGCGVGGGSLINAGVALRPDARVFDDPVWPDPIARDGTLDKGYARAAQWLRPACDPRASEMTKFQALAASGRSTGQSPVAPQITVNFAGGVSAAGIAQPACTRCGDCCGGCNVGAKTTVATTYLADAVRHGAQVFSHSHVRTVRKGQHGGWRVTVQQRDTTRGTGTAPGEFEMSAPMVILAAGTLGSTEILLRSRADGLTLSDRLGSRFSANGDIIAFGYGAREPVNAVGIGHPAKVTGLEIGAAVSGQIEFNDPDRLEHQLCVQEGVLPSSLAPALPLLFIPNGRLLGALQSLVNGVYNGPFARLQTFFAVSHDSASGRFTLDDDRLVLSWPGAAREPVYARLDAALGAIVDEAGGSYVRNPLAGTMMGQQPSTAHPLGGCGMGRDCADGVVNHKGQVFDATAGRGSAEVYNGLYVVDGAVVPRSLGVNPLLTITALAERAMIHLAEDHDLAFDDQPLMVHA